MVGHFSMDGLNQYEQIRQLLTSILQSIGFSSAAAVSASRLAAVITLENAPETVESAPIQEFTEHARSIVQGTRQIESAESPPTARTGTDESDNASTRNNSASTDASTPSDNQNNPEQSPPPSFLPPPTPISSTEDWLTALTSTDVLVPGLATRLRAVADDMESLSPFGDMLRTPGNGREPIQHIISVLSAISGAAASMTGMLALLNSEAGRSRTMGIIAEGGGESGNGGNGGDSSSSDGSDTSDGSEVYETDGGTSPIVDRSAEESTSPSNSTRVRQTNEISGGEPTPTVAERSTNPIESEGSDQARNAAFFVRILCYYMCSFFNFESEQDVAGPTEVEGNAVAVLDAVYGDGITQAPANKALQVFHEVMQKFTPQEFHAILKGDLEAIALRRRRIWEIIIAGLDMNEESEDGNGNEERSVDDDDVADYFVDVVCEAIHEFIHNLERIIQEAHQNEGEWDRGDISDDFCQPVMRNMHLTAFEFVEVMTDVGMDQAEFKLRLMSWMKNAAGTTLAAIAGEMHINFDLLMDVLRVALADISVELFGRPYVVVFPLVANLFVQQLRSAYEGELSHHGDWLESASGEFITYREVDGPEREERRGTTDRESGRAEGQSRFHVSSDGTRVASGDVRSTSRDSNSNTDHGNGDDTQVHDSSGRSANRTDQAMDSVTLDDDELDSLAAELVAEDSGVDVDTTYLDELAKELANETTGGHGKDASSRAGPSVGASKPAAVSMRGLAGSSGGRMGLGVGGIGGVGGTMFANGGSAGSVRSGSASFARSSAVPRTPARRDEFDLLGNSSHTDVWRRVVLDDERRINCGGGPEGNGSGVLSRAYRFDRSNVPVLDADHAATMAVDSARAAASAARLSEEASQELLRIAAGNGNDYLREVENAITSRLTSDGDFDPQRFPNAARRFLPNTRF